MIEDRPRPLRVETGAVEGEAARSVFTRALCANRVPHSWAILKLVGAAHRNRNNVAEDEALDFDELCRILNVEPADLKARRYDLLDGRFRSFFGMPITDRAIERKTRRFSPASLAASPHVRALWELRDLPFCGESWELLRDDCVCGKRQGWTRVSAIDRCDECGRPLWSAPADLVPEELRGPLRLVVLLASPLDLDRQAAFEMLPTDLRTVCRGQLFSTLLRMRGMAVRRNEVESLAAACAALIDWPAGLTSLYDAANKSRPAWTALESDYYGLATRAAPEGACIPETAGAPAGRPGRRPIGIRPAGELGHLDPDTLRWARDAGHLRSLDIPRAGRRVPVFLPDEVAAFAEIWHSRVSADALGRRLGIGGFAAEQIATQGVIPANGPSTYTDGPAFLERDVAALETAFERGASSDIEDPIALRDALMAIHGRPKPWAAIISAMLGQSLPYAIGSNARNIPAFTVPRTSIEYLTTLQCLRRTGVTWRPRRHLVQREAAEMLNAGRNPRPLTDVAGVGINPIVYALDDLAAYGRLAISTPEYAFRSGMPVSKAYHHLMARNVPKMGNTFWCRPSANATI